MDSVASVDHKEGNNENKEDSAEGGQRVESQGREEDSTLLDVEPAGDSDDNEGSLYDYPLGSDLEASQTGESNVVVFSHPGGDVEVGAAESENHLWVEFHILMLAFGGMVQDHKAIAMLCLLGLPLLLLIFPSQEPGGSVRWWKRSPLFWCVTECTVTRAQQSNTRMQHPFSHSTPAPSSDRDCAAKWRYRGRYERDTLIRGTNIRSVGILPMIKGIFWSANAVHHVATQDSMLQHRTAGCNTGQQVATWHKKLRTCCVATYRNTAHTFGASASSR